MSRIGASAVLERIGVRDALAEEQLGKFVELLLEESQRQNLISPHSVKDVWERHILDSAQLIAKVPRGTSRWLDLGSGAGLPGLVTAIILRSVAFTLVEVRTLRAEWLRTVAGELGLKNVQVFAGKLEAMPTIKVDVISARAFAPLDRLVSLAARFSTAETVWVLPKGKSAWAELDKLDGWCHAFKIEPSISDPSAGIIVGALKGPKGTTS